MKNVDAEGLAIFIVMIIGAFLIAFGILGLMSNSGLGVPLFVLGLGFIIGGGFIAAILGRSGR